MIRIGMLGVAHPHADLWAKAWENDPRVELCAVWDSDSNRGAEWGKQFEIASYESLESLLANEDINAVGICAETSQHAELIVAAAKAGKAILCEKPPALSLKECDVISEAVKQNGVRLMQGFPMRVDPGNKYIKSLLDNGTIGEITSIRKRHGIGWAANGLSDQRLSWIIKKELAGGGAFIDEGIHAADFLIWMLGEPVSIQAFIPESKNGFEVEEEGVAIIRFKNNVFATMQSSWTFAAATNTTEIYGREGTIIQQFNDCASTQVNGESNFSVQIYSNKSEMAGWQYPRVPSVFKNIHAEVAKTFINCLLTGDEFPSGIQEGKAALNLILKGYEAAATGKEVFF